MESLLDGAQCIGLSHDYFTRTNTTDEEPTRLFLKSFFNLSCSAIRFADHAAPCRKALGRMLIHPVGELRRAHQAGLHRNVSEIRSGDDLLVAICRRRETAEHGDDLDHERTPSQRKTFAPLVE